MCIAWMIELNCILLLRLAVHTVFALLNISALFAHTLRIAQQFEPNTLRLPEDVHDIYIWCLSVVSKELLLLAESANSAVKELHFPTGRLKLVYSEPSEGWRVCNVRAVRDAVGEFLVLLEWKELPSSAPLFQLFSRMAETRLSVVRKEAGKYCYATHFPLEMLLVFYVCSPSCTYFK